MGGVADGIADGIADGKSRYNRCNRCTIQNSGGAALSRVVDVLLRGHTRAGAWIHDLRGECVCVSVLWDCAVRAPR